MGAATCQRTGIRANSAARLLHAQARCCDLGVGLGPGLVETGFDGRSLLARGVQALREAVESPAVLGPVLEVGAVDLLGVALAAGGEQDRAQRVARGLEPVGGLH